VFYPHDQAAVAQTETQFQTLDAIATVLDGFQSPLIANYFDACLATNTITTWHAGRWRPCVPV